MGYLEGADVSKYNGDPSLDGRAFLIVRATYGDEPDPKRLRHLRRARAAGLVTGAYHFGVGRAQTPIETQARAFLAAAPAIAEYLALDLEANWLERDDGSHYLGPTMTNAEARQFVAYVHAHDRRKIVLYHSRFGFPTGLGQDGNWVADYRRLGHPPTIPWTFWQFTSKPYDLDHFHGDLAALHELAGRSLAAGHR